MLIKRISRKGYTKLVASGGHAGDGRGEEIEGTIEKHSRTIVC